MNLPLTVLEFRDRAETYFGPKLGVVDGDRRFTYAELGERTHRLANALRALGVERGDRVAVLAPNTHQMLEAYFGVLGAGAVLTPLNPRLRPAELAAIAEHSGATALLYHGGLAPLVASLAPLCPSLTRRIVFEASAPGPDPGYEELLAAASASPSGLEVDEDDPATILYTSGSTGRPKGVVLTHRNLYLHAMANAVALRACDADVVLEAIPLFHANGLGQPHVFTMVGATHVMLRKLDAELALSLIERWRVTHLIGVPAIHATLLAHPELSRYDLGSLRFVMAGGAPASPTLLRAMSERLCPSAMVGYGLSETSPLVALAVPRRHLEEADTSEESLARRSRTGWPVPGTRVRVVDSEGGDVPADGRTVGEILIRSHTVMKEYWRDPDETARALHGGWLRSGDLATLDPDGSVQIVDRAKDIIISGGEKVSSVEVENVLLTHPAVQECAVVAAPDERWGESPVATVVLRPAGAATPEELVAFCRERLAAFKVPRHVEIRAELPRSGTGKVSKAELREPLWKGLSRRVH